MTPFTVVHVIISLLAILSGLVVVFGMITGKSSEVLTGFFLATTVATSVTGFCYFPFLGFTPGQAFGILSMILLGLAIYGLYVKHCTGNWRWIYVVTAAASLYLNCFVLVLQSFEKIPVLKATGANSPLFIVAQLVTAAVLITGGVLATRRFVPAASASA